MTYHLKMKKENMKKKNADNPDDDLLSEYDLDQLPIIARGPGHRRKAKAIRVTRVSLEPDVAEIFPDEAAVNQALRLLIRVTRNGVNYSI